MEVLNKEAIPRKVGTRVIRFERTDIEYIKEQMPFIQEELKKHGMLVLKGFDYECP
jgi:hypothetical protein